MSSNSFLPVPSGFLATPPPPTLLARPRVPPTAPVALAPASPILGAVVDEMLEAVRVWPGLTVEIVAEPFGGDGRRTPVVEGLVVVDLVEPNEGASDARTRAGVVAGVLVEGVLITFMFSLVAERAGEAVAFRLVAVVVRALAVVEVSGRVDAGGAMEALGKADGTRDESAPKLSFCPGHHCRKH